MTSACPALRLPLGVVSVLLLAVALLVVGCGEEQLLSPDAPDARFDRYVALGNSVTAGYQSRGINQETQSESFAVRVAAQMETRFRVPTLRMPGCPPPLTNLYTGARVGGAGAASCALRSSPVPTTLNNVAVPGAQVIDAVNNGAASANPNELTTLFLGGRTQVEAATAVQPTFASVWIGDNDVLLPALRGDTTGITAQADFEARYTQMIDSLEAAGADESGIMIGVPNETYIPHFSPGASYFFAKQAGGLPPSFSVADNCAPTAMGGVGDQMRVSLVYGFEALLTVAQEGAQVTLDCEDNRPLSEILEPTFGNQLPERLQPIADYSILTGDELQVIVAAAQGYNAFIKALADARNWAYLDPNGVLGPLYAANASDPDPTNDLVPKFPITPTAETPNPDAFGRFFSLDGVHPSAALHRILTNRVVQEVNDTYGTSLPQIEASDVPALLQ